jgi:imidazolonepropionase-like amidohydrolase
MPHLDRVAMTWFVFVVCVTLAGCRSGDTARSPVADRWLLTGMRLYVAPNVPPIENGWVLVEGGRIGAVGDSATTRPASVRTDTACSGGVIAAGFQNSHVHLTDSVFADAATRPAAGLEEALSRMLASYGFTTVVDTGSLVDNTVALRQRIERGEMTGPSILTAGIPLYPENGIPIYLRDLPASLLSQLPEPTTTDEAIDIVRRNFTRGANGSKLFVVTPVEGGQIRRMAADVARAAAAETHARGGLVMAHPTNPDGVAAAVAAGVDIIVHTTIDESQDGVWSADLVSEMRARNVSVVPTLKLWRYELNKEQVPTNVRDRLVGVAQRQLKAFSDAGGQVLFGTDVGYMADFDPSEEYELMAGAGLTPMQILSSLTTAPAARWKASERRGQVRQGFDADLVVLNADPGVDPSGFADVRCTVRGGRQIFVRGAR